MAGKKNTDKNIAYQIEKQLRWELAQKRKKQRYSIIAIIICSIIVVGLAVTISLAYIHIPNKDDSNSSSPTPTESANEAVPAAYAPGDWDIASDNDVFVKVIEDGSGEEVKYTDTITAKYVGWKAKTGEEFDGSYKHGGTADFPLSGVIGGWTRALWHQKVGTKLAVYIPDHFGYGVDDGKESQQPLGPLVFYVEIVKVASSAEGADEVPAEQNGSHVPTGVSSDIPENAGQVTVN